MPTQNAANFGTGTTGQVLTSNGTGVPPSFQAVPSWNLIATHSASTSASVTFTSGITTTYINYALVFNQVNVSANGDLLIQLSTDGGGTYISTGYLSGAINWAYNSTTAANNNSTAGLYLVGTSTSQQMSGMTFLYDLTSTQYPVNAGNAGRLNPATNFTMYHSSGSYSTKILVNALQILNTSGTINTGQFSLFGISR